MQGRGLGGRTRAAAGWLLILLSARSGAAQSLAERLQPLIERHRGQVSVAVKHLGTGESFAYEADRPMPTASLIKLPIMVAAYSQFAAGQLDPQQRVPLREEDKVPGSGVLTEHFSAGTEFPLSDLVHLMIVFSDNTATNLVLDQVGIAEVNGLMASVGLSETRVNSPVYRRDRSVDLARSERFGLGSTTAAEMVRLLERLQAGELVDRAACDAMTAHLKQCEDRTKIARELPAGVIVAHKTGEVSASRTDAGLIFGPSGPIALCVLTDENEDQQYRDDNEAHRLIGRIAAEVFQHFNPQGIDPAAERLGVGSQGERVAALQRTLNRRLDPSPHLSVDGEFGPATEEAVIAFQRSCGREANGVVDEALWEKLGPATEAEPAPSAAEIAAANRPTRPADPLDGPPLVSAAAWIVTDPATGRVLAEHESRTPREIASITKIMTAWLIVQWWEEHPETRNERLVLSPAAAATEGSSSGLRAGESLTIEEWMYALLLPSGNDAAAALAEHFGPRLAAARGLPSSGDPAAQFLAAMNDESERLGLRDSHWRNPHGLPDPQHVSTAADVAELARIAIGSPVLRGYVGTRRYACQAEAPDGIRRQVVWDNTNQLLDVEAYIGIKTGTTQAAGACLVGAERRGDASRIAVVLGSASSAARYLDCRNLIRWSWIAPRGP